MRKTTNAVQHESLSKNHIFRCELKSNNKFLSLIPLHRIAINSALQVHKCIKSLHIAWCCCCCCFALCYQYVTHYAWVNDWNRNFWYLVFRIDDQRYRKTVIKRHKSFMWMCCRKKWDWNVSNSDVSIDGNQPIQ